MMAGTKIYRGIINTLPEQIAKPVLDWISKQPILTRQRGLRGMATDMAKRKQFLLDVLCQVDYAAIATEFGRQLFKTVIPSKEIQLLLYGHDLSWLSKYNGKTPSSVLRIGYIGQLIEAKGPQLLIQAFKQLPATSPAILSIYGQLSQNGFGHTLQSLAAGDPRIQFKGTYLREESAQIYANLDVLVIPSMWYDFPLVAHEALATKTVILATDIAGLNEIVRDEVTGLLFERGNITSLKLQLQRLLDLPALVAELRENLVNIKSIDEAVRELEDLYVQVTSGTSSCCI